MNISDLFTKHNLEMFNALRKQSYTLRDLASTVNCSPAKAHQAIKLFKKRKLVTVKKKKNAHEISLNHSPLTIGIKALLNKYQLLRAVSLRKLLQHGSVGVYGSFARGEDNDTSDIDLVLLTEHPTLSLQPLIRAFEAEIGREINPLIRSTQQLLDMKAKDKEFFLRLQLTTVWLGGEGFANV